MSEQFLTSHDDCGDIAVRSGWVIEKGGLAIRVGPVGDAIKQAVENDGVVYLGGSGRNLMVTGMPDAGYNGAWMHGYPGKWRTGILTLVQVPGGATTITDGVDDLAIKASGGPVGSLASTAYGAAFFGSAFTAVVTAEWSAPGVIPSAVLTTSASGPMAGGFTPTDAANLVSDLDPLLTIHIAEDGEAHLIYDGVIIAIREGGANDDSAGEYESTVDGLPWNPATPEDDDGEAVEVNSFGILTLVYSWPATPDLDTNTWLLDERVGYPGPYTSAHMTHSGDDTSPSGSETVVIDLATAWDDGVIGDTADITCMADWFPSGSSGPATLDVSYSIPGFTPMSLTILPGNVSPGSTTTVAALRINADGTVTQNFAPWTATVTRIPVPPPAGVIYLKEIEAAGNLASVDLPKFAATQPADTTNHFHIPLAVSDGAGVVEIMWTGMILRR